jgi:hypothetical protein
MVEFDQFREVKNMTNHVAWMVLSGLTGLSCFVIIHFTKLLKSPKYAAYLQLAANTFVFCVWGRAFLDFSGFAKLFAFGGTVVPVIMATITIWRVFGKQQEVNNGADS